MAFSLAPIPAIQVFQPASVCEAFTYDEAKSKVLDFAESAKQFWDDSEPDRVKLTGAAKKKWQKLQKDVAKEYKKAKKKGKKGLKAFKKWRKQQEKEFWQWYAKQTSQK